MIVPLLDLSQQLKPLRDDIVREVTDLIDSTSYILGERVEEFETAVASYCGAQYGVGVSSGTDALLASLMAMDVGRDDYVLTTPYTFIATLGSIMRLGAKPIFVDIDPVSFNIDPSKVEQFFEEEPKRAQKVKAIIPVHLYGQCADMGRILPIAHRYGVSVVEDAAQAIGACCPVFEDGIETWKRAGSMGDAGCFSFFPSKNLGGIGDGGMIVVNNVQLSENIRIIRGHGGNPKYHHGVLGGNFRLDPIQAVALNIKLPHLPKWHHMRRANAKTYNRLFSESGLIEKGHLKLPTAVYKKDAISSGACEDYHIFNQFVIRVVDRDGLRTFLGQHGVGCEIYYPIPLHKQKMMDTPYQSLHLPEAEKAAAETLALPIYPELTEDMIAYVVETIARFYNS